MASSECKYSFLEAKTKLEALCAYQERCSYELERKMFQWGIHSEDQNRLLAHLIEYNFLNEERFAEAFVSGKVKIKKWGKIKIKRELKLRRISDYSTRKAFEAISDELYMNNLKQLATRKFAALEKEKNSYSKKAKICRFLSSKGYETDLIMDVVDEVMGSV